MRSRAQFKAHPLHPALIPFPFAFLSGTLLFDAGALMLGRPVLGTTGSHLNVAGIAAGLLAAIPGAIDYLYTVPPRSSGKTRATRHALINVGVLALFAAAWFTRGDGGAPNVLTIVIELPATLLLGYGGWLGGTLVTRNMIGVDHRYANKGRWQEQDVTGLPGEPVVVGHVDDLEESQMKLLRVNGRRIALARTADGYTAFDDRCTHRGGSLAGGVLVDGTVHCLWHGSQFDVTKGKVSCGPATQPIHVYQVTESKNGRLLLVAPKE